MSVRYLCMKTPFACFLILAVLALAGCGSVGSDFTTGVREKFEGPTYHTKVVSADVRAVYDASKQASDKLGFRFVSGGPAQGRLQALSGLAATDSLQGARQLSLAVKLSAVAEGTEVAVLITEQVEDDFNKGSGQATETTLRESPLYEAFYRNLEQTLPAK